MVSPISHGLMVALSLMTLALILLDGLSQELIWFLLVVVVVVVVFLAVKAEMSHRISYLKEVKFFKNTLKELNLAFSGFSRL